MSEYEMDLMWDRIVATMAERAARYRRWRSAFYAQRARYLEGETFAVYADSEAEAIYMLTRAALRGEERSA